jgi:hypothetical protein
MQAQLRNPSLPIREIAAGSGVYLGIEQIRSAYLRGGGSLLRPRSWQVDLVLDARGVLAGNAGMGALHRFDSAQAVMTIRQGVLRVPDARLRSERLSLLGNGLVLSDGRHLSVVRVVADDEYARAIRRIMIGSHLSQGWTSSWMKPLVTPDRRYRDIHFEGILPQATVDLGRRGERIPLGEAADVLRRFLEREAGERQPAEPNLGKGA